MRVQVMFPDPKSGELAVRCERCGAVTNLETQVQPLGNEPGAQLYRCPTCKHLTWIEWWGWHRRPAGDRV